MKSLVNLLLLVSLSSCAINHRHNESPGRFKEYENLNSMKLKLDSQIITDKYFKILLPITLKKITFDLNEGFSHKFDFDHNQKMILLYLPFRSSSTSLKYLELSFEKFTELCKKEKLYNFIPNNNLKYRKKRYFGLRKTSDEAFYIIYLNVRKDVLRTFNVSLDSVAF